MSEFDIRKVSDLFKKITTGKHQHFTGVFQPVHGTADSVTHELGTGLYLSSLTIYIDQNSLGPMFVDASVSIEGVVHHIGQDWIQDYDGITAKRFQWVGQIPLSSKHKNTLNISHYNISGSVINMVRYTGTVRLEE